tara:strand:- start:45 stop:401 length:357 start_codon:yes stop_codon:yes gene_type:complete
MSSATITHLRELHASLKQENEVLTKKNAELETRLGEADQIIARRERDVQTAERASEDIERQLADLKEQSRTASIKLKQYEIALEAARGSQRNYVMSMIGMGVVIAALIAYSMLFKALA